MARFRYLLGPLAAACLATCGSDDCDDGTASAAGMYAVLSAFPAELAPLVERAEIDETIELGGGRTLRVGRLGGVRVVLGLAGIGLINAQEGTRTVLERYQVDGVIVSGVAGSPLRIADVAVPEEWRFADGDTSYAPPAQWLALARRVAGSSLELERCTVPPSGVAESVCLPFAPSIVVGGSGESDDPFNGMALRCNDAVGGTYGDVFGCDVEVRATFHDAGIFTAHGVAESDDPVAVDMETAAIARAAAAHGVPFIAFRAVSDGAEDPLMLPGFPTQFFAYYRLAARNAAAAAIAFLERL